MHDDHDEVPCVSYAAKSTQDRKGSIAEQLSECRAAIDSDEARIFVAQYSDEAFSAFLGSRGPGLAEAMQHAEDLARESGRAELWAQHSDRLARGDGKSARHAVEIALWASKRGIQVHTLQDPGTFRDLLYAVVIGERNHEDSRRKGLATSAGRRRAAARGDFIGYLPDGYRLAVAVDEDGGVTKRMEFDPARKPVIETAFAMAIRGKGSGAIARALNDAGWLTKPYYKRGAPKRFIVGRVIDILKNPRYAGLAMYDGKIVARDCWPAYITEREHERIRARVDARRATKEPRQLETYLLARLGVCGHCGCSLFSMTGQGRADGTFARRYTCSGHVHDLHHPGRCRAGPMDAEQIEAMLASCLGTLLFTGVQVAPTTEAPPKRSTESWITASERQQLGESIAAGDDWELRATLDSLISRIRPERDPIRDATGPGHRARQRDQLADLRQWAERERSGRTEDSRQETVRLNLLLRSWFHAVVVTADDASIRFTVEHRVREGAPNAPRYTTVRIDRSQWVRFAPLARRHQWRHHEWLDSEILGALQAWRDETRRSPVPAEWEGAARPLEQQQPIDVGVTSLDLRDPRGQHDTGEGLDVIHELADWMAVNDTLPVWADWLRELPQHPCPSTVRVRFGSWSEALAAAGLS